MLEYEYKPLNLDTGEIRLVELHPGFDDDSIQVSIFTTIFTAAASTTPHRKALEEIEETVPEGWSVWETLESQIIFNNEEEDYTTWDHPDPDYDRSNYETVDELRSPSQDLDYESLSYVWSSMDNPQSLNVAQDRYASHSNPPYKEGSLRTLHIGRNLHDALWHLRRPDESRILWVDAICINQNDLVERSEQVNRMRSIYSRAKRVVVYLGPSSQNSALALEKLQSIGQEVECSIQNLWMPAPGCTEKEWYGGSSLEDYRIVEEVWQAICDLVLRPWFARLWTFQEIQLASRHSIFLCGRDEITWCHLRRALLRCAALTTNGALSLLIRWNRVSYLSRCCKNGHPIKLLEFARSAECSEPRDKIYALLGLFPPTLAAKLVPEYTTPVREVYKQAFLAYLEWTGSLDMLYYAGPSWVPNWSIAHPEMDYQFENFAASSDTVASFSEVPPNILKVTGVLFDEIKDVRTINQTNDPQATLQVIRNLCIGHDGDSELVYPTGESLEEACAWTIACGSLLERYPEDTIAKTSLSEIIDVIRSTKPGAEVDDYLQVDQELFQSLCITKKGYFSLADCDVRVGDQVCVLLGCALPAILRPEQSGEHKFLGCSYIHGIMDGEVLLGPLPKDFKAYNAVNSEGHYRPYFMNIATEEKGLDDPRLDSLPSQWTLESSESFTWTYKTLLKYKNTETGEAVNSDPRLLPEALRARGVQLQEFSMI